MYKYVIMLAKRLTKCKDCPFYKPPFSCGWGQIHNYRPAKSCPLKEVLDGDVEVVRGNLVDINPHIEMKYERPNEGQASMKLFRIKTYCLNFYRECPANTVIDEILDIIDNK